MWDDMSNMAAERAAPERDVDTRMPLPDELVCGALDGRRLLNEPIELFEWMLERDEGRAEFEWTASVGSCSVCVCVCVWI